MRTRGIAPAADLMRARMTLPGRYTRRAAVALLASVLLLLSAGAASGQEAGGITVVVVRHAEKVDDSADPHLSEAGVRRAEALADALEHAGVTAILATQYRRTQETAAPLARRAGVPVPVVETTGGAATHAAAVAAAVRAQPPGALVVVVGHSNTVPAIIAALGGPDVGGIADEEYSDFFVLELEHGGTRLIRARY
jgi:phosphohistidine phosphatase SixA